MTGSRGSDLPQMGRWRSGIDPAGRERPSKLPDDRSGLARNGPDWASGDPGAVQIPPGAVRLKGAIVTRRWRAFAGDTPSRILRSGG